MRSKMYYIAKKMITAALAVNAPPLIWEIVSSFMFKNCVSDEAINNYGLIVLIGKALIPITMSFSFVIALTGILFSAISMKKEDKGAGKLLVTHLIITAISCAVVCLTIKYVGYLYNYYTAVY